MLLNNKKIPLIPPLYSNNCFITDFKEWSDQSHLPAKFGSHRSCRRTKFFYHVTSNQKIMWFFMFSSLSHSNHLATCGNHRYCGSANIKFFICHMKSLSNDVWPGGQHLLTPYHHHAKFGDYRCCASTVISFNLQHGHRVTTVPGLLALCLMAREMQFFHFQLQF